MLILPYIACRSDMAESASVLQEIHDVLQVCGISKPVACTQLIYIEGFNSLDNFGLMDRETDFLETANCLASRDVATCMNLGKVQIEGIQALVWVIHDHQTHNQPLIAADFGQVAKMAAMTGKQIEKERVDKYATLSGIGKFKAEDFEASEDGFPNILYQKHRQLRQSSGTPSAIGLFQEYSRMLRQSGYTRSGFPERRLVRTTGRFLGCSKRI